MNVEKRRSQRIQEFEKFYNLILKRNIPNLRVRDLNIIVKSSALRENKISLAKFDVEDRIRKGLIRTNALKLGMSSDRLQSARCALFLHFLDDGNL